MMMFIVQLVAGAMLLVALHTSAGTLVSLSAGIEVREVAIGAGPALFKLGKFKLGMLPFAGYVKLGDTREDPSADPATALNHKPAVVQATVALAGCVALVLFATVILAGAGVSQTIAGFRQIIAGAFAPMSTAQEYLRATYAWSTNHGYLALLGVLAAKVAALNLFPLALLNGGQAIFSLACSTQNDPPNWYLHWNTVSYLLFIALIGSWACALCFFVFSN